MDDTAGHKILRLICFVTTMAVAAGSLGACGYTPAQLGITGPQPRQSLTPPAPTAAEANPAAAEANPAATTELPGVRTGGDAYAPSVQMAPPAAGKFYGSD